MPCVIGKLPDDQYATIVTNYTHLIEDIKHDPVGLACSLFEKRVFDVDDLEIIKREERSVSGSKTDAAAELLKIVLNSGDAAYGKFIEALKENGYSGAVRRLRSNKEIKEVQEPKDGNPEDRFGKTGVVTEKQHLKVEKGRPPEDIYNKIRDNYVFLTDEIKNDYGDVMYNLFNSKAIGEDDMEQITREEMSEDGKKAATRKMLLILLTRGETGYTKFLEALYANKCFRAVYKLKPGYCSDGSDQAGITTDNKFTPSRSGDISVTHNDLFGYCSDGSDQAGITTDNKFTPSRSGDISVTHNDLFGKRSVDSPRLRTMKDEALTNLNYVKEKKYVETRALGEGLKILESHHILGIIGAAGDGKSILSMMIANQFIEEHEEYKPLLINDLHDLKEVNFEDDKYLYVIDDMYGKFNKLQARINKWPTHFGTLRINKEKGKLRIIYILRDYIYRSSRYQLDKYDLFVDNIERTTRIFLHESQFSLNNEEKRHFLDFYSVTSDQIISKISDCFGFPSIVSLCSKLTNDKLPADLDGSHAFLLLELETFWKENEYIYATLLLAFCLHRVSERDLKQRSSERVKSLISTITKEVCKEFELKVAKCMLNELSDTFIKYIEENYVKIFSLRDFVEAPFLHHLSGKCMEMALKYCSFELLMALVRTNHQEDRCIIIHESYYDDLSKRCIKELQEKNPDIVNHPAFIDCSFLSYFLGRNGIANLLHDTKFINLGDIREIQESGNFLHYITLHGDLKCLKAVLVYFQDFLPQLLAEKTDMEWDTIGLATVSIHDPIEKINLLKEKKIGDFLALPHLAVYVDKFEIVKHISNLTKFDKSKLDIKSRTVLHNACDSKHDNPQIINFLIGAGFDVNAKDESGITPLHLAVVRGKHQTVSILINSGAEVNVKDNRGRLPIHIISSSCSGRTDVDASHILKQLIQAGSLLHEADYLGRVPLLEIIATVDRKCFKLLFKTVQTSDTRHEYIKSLIHESTELDDCFIFRSILDYVHEMNINFLDDKLIYMCCDSVDKMRILHNKGINFDVVDANGCSILHNSCKFGSTDTVRYLVNEIGLNINQKDKNGFPPVFYSVVSDIDPFEKLKFLLSKGCSLQVVDVKNRGLLHLSCIMGTLQTVKYLINEVGLDVDHKDNEGNTPVVYCSVSNLNPISKLKFLSLKGVGLHAVVNNNMSLLHLSCKENTIETVEYLVNDVGLNVKHKDNKGMTPATHCCKSNINPVKKLKFLSSKGASLHAVDNNNMSLLHYSCAFGTIETVVYLVNEIGLDVHYKGNRGETMAMCCCINNSSSVTKLKFLSSKGVSLHAIDAYNMSLLHCSCIHSTVETVKYLVDKVGLDVNHKDHKGNTPALLCSSSFISPVEKLKFLSSKGVSLHVVDNINKSLLSTSCLEGTVETVEYLVNEIGLDVYHQDNKGRTPAMCCSLDKMNPVKKLKFLSSKGISLHAVGDDNASLLHYGCQGGTLETVEYLVNDVGLDVNHIDNMGVTQAVSCSRSKISPVKKLQFLSSKEVSLHDISLLHNSCVMGTIETVKYLVNEVHLDVNESYWYITPLFVCFLSEIQQMEKVMFLIFKGAKITICRPYKDFFKNIL